jgi:D-alanyl-D-alanine dipeptidase
MDVKIIIVIMLIFGDCLSAQHKLPSGFCYITESVPQLKVSLRYLGEDNFLGRKVNGYFSNKAILSCEAADALKKVALDLQKIGYGLILFDGYRPQSAVNDFVSWAKLENDTANKHIFYPELSKSTLIPLGYISSKSRHSSGSTVDIGLYYLQNEKLVDMGSSFDFFGEISHHDNKQISSIQQANRIILKTAMLANGFRSYEKEWWHYTLNNEPFKNQYFDFPIK